MARFTLFRFQKSRAVPDFDVLEFDSVEAAITHAQALIMRHGYSHVEVVNDNQTIRVERPA